MDTAVDRWVRQEYWFPSWNVDLTQKHFYRLNQYSIEMVARSGLLVYVYFSHFVQWNYKEERDNNKKRIKLSASTFCSHILYVCVQDEKVIKRKTNGFILAVTWLQSIKSHNNLKVCDTTWCLYTIQLYFKSFLIFFLGSLSVYFLNVQWQMEKEKE